MYKCSDAQIFICSDDQMFKCLNVQMFKYINAQISKCSTLQMLKCSNVQMCTCSNVQMFKCSNDKCSNIQMLKYSNVQCSKSQCTNVSMFKCSDVQMSDGQIFKCPNIQMLIMLKFCRSVPLEFFRSFLFGFSWQFWKVGFCQDRWLVTSVESKSCHKNQRLPPFYTHVKNVMMKVWYIFSNLLNTFTFLCDPAPIEICNGHPNKIPTPLDFSQC